MSALKPNANKNRNKVDHRRGHGGPRYVMNEDEISARAAREVVSEASQSTNFMFLTIPCPPHLAPPFSRRVSPRRKGATTTPRMMMREAERAIRMT